MTYIVYCGECDRDLHDIGTPFVVGDPFVAERFQALEGVPQPQNGDESLCPFCGARLYAPKGFGGAQLEENARYRDNA